MIRLGHYPVGDTRAEGTMDEFWIDPLSIDGNHAAIRACYNEFSVTIVIERKNGRPITKAEAQVACDAVVSRLPPQAPSR